MKAHRIVGMLFILLACVPSAFGDGKFFPVPQYKLTPAIPQQRAILAHRDGVETLVIESTLDSAGTDFGWVIPLPAVPTDMAATTAGLLDTLSLNITPKVTAEMSNTPIYVLAIIILAVLYYAWLRTPSPQRRHGILNLLVVLVLILFVASIFLPTLGHVRALTPQATKVNGVTIEKNSVIGSYDTAVLTAETPAALDAWLTDNGYTPLGADATRIVADYIDQGWCFFTACLHRDHGGVSRPHPVKLTFPAEQPIYPMRLTSLALGPLYLELYVVADAAAAHPHLTSELTDRFIEGRDSLMFGATYIRRIGHPDALSLMWDNCILTKLIGTLDNEQMAQDFRLSLTSSHPLCRHYYSRRAALKTALTVGLLVALLILLLVTFILYKRLLERTSRLRLCRRVLPLVLIIALTSAAITYASLDQAEISSLPRKVAVKRDYIMGEHVVKNWAEDYTDRVARKFLPEPSPEPHVVADRINDYLQCIVVCEPYFFGSTLYGDSPRTLAAGVFPTGFCLRYIGRNGMPTDISLRASQTAFPTSIAIDDWLAPQKGSFHKLHAYARDYALVDYSPGRGNPRYGAFLAEAYIRQPREHIPNVVAAVRELLEEEVLDETALSFEVSLLGCIAHEHPPRDVLDEEQVRAFLDKVTASSGRR